MTRDTRRRRIRATAIAFGLTALLAGIPASAQEQAARTIGGWTIAVGSDGKGCFLTRQYDRPGGTTLMLGLEADGTNHLTVLNANWSIAPQDRLKLNFRLTKGGYPNQIAIGIAADGKQGFVTGFEKKFPGYLARSLALQISRGNVPVEQLDLSGSGAAVAELTRCVDRLRAGAKADPQRAERGGDIPLDPFAPDAKRRSGD